MATKVIMPKQGLLMTEGHITKWLISEGDQVIQDEPLFEMETDKLTITIDSPASGVLLKIISAAGETVPVTETIAVIGEAGEDISGLLAELSDSGEVSEQPETPSASSEKETVRVQESSTAGGRFFITPRAKMRAGENNIDYTKLTGTGPEGLVTEADVLSAVANKVKTTPVAAKIIAEENLSAQDISGSGVGGRIMKRDVADAGRVAASDAPPAFSFADQEQLIPFSGMRKVISERMMQSLQGSAQANNRIKVDMSEAINLRTKMKETGVKVSYNDILIRVVTAALREYPYLNGSVVEEGIVLKNYVNMGLAVSVPNGLLVPNIKNAERLTLKEIAEKSADLIEKTLNGSLSQEEYSNGTFTISNLGMFDIDEFTAIINPPESGILGVGKIEKTPVVIDDEIVIKPMMTLSLTYDHRIVDGALAAQFLQYIKKLLANPYLLI